MTSKNKRIKTSRKSVLKGIQSLQKRISEHEAKILKVQNSSFSEDLKEEKIRMKWESAFRQIIKECSNVKSISSNTCL